MEKTVRKRVLWAAAILLLIAVVAGTCVFTAANMQGRRILKKDTIVTVGYRGDFETLGEALSYLSEFYPAYRNDGVTCEIQILSGTTIREQINVSQMDLRYITITSEDPTVPVDSRGWDENGLNYHDLRGDVAFLGGENGAGIPTIGTLFTLQQFGDRGTVGCFLNRGSCGIILEGCGFEGFYDGCLVNNESRLVMREAVSRKMVRWGIHSRHGSEISARGAELTGCGLAAYADRGAELDVRGAVLDSSVRALDCRNLSSINANGCQIYYCTADSGHLILAESGGEINCGESDIQYGKTDVFGVSGGGTIYSADAKVVAKDARTYSQEANVQTEDGIIYR